MNNNIKNKYDERVKIIKAMGHASRLFMIDELSKGELSVCELRDMIGDDISTISKHLTVLKNAGLLFYDKRGSKVFYKVNIKCVSQIICCADNVIKVQREKRA